MEFTKENPLRTTRELRESYDRIFRRAPLREAPGLYRRLMRVLAPERGSTLLDVACGGGYLLAEAEAAGLRAVGVDLSAVALELARDGAPGAAAVLGDGERLPFAGGAFDCVTNIGSLEHFFDPGAGVREMARVLKKGGRLLVMVPNSYFLMTVWNVLWQGDSGRATDQEVDRWATRREWSDLLRGNGLEVERVLKHNYSARRSPLLYKLVRPFIPLNLSYCFLFLCRKP